MCVIESDDFANNRNQVIDTENAIFGSIWHVKAKTLVDFKPANTAVIKAFVIKEHTLNHLTSVVDRRKVTWAELAIDLNQGLVWTVRGVFFEGCLDIFHVAGINISKRFFDVADL